MAAFGATLPFRLTSGIDRRCPKAGILSRLVFEPISETDAAAGIVSGVIPVAGVPPVPSVVCTLRCLVKSIWTCAAASRRK